MTDDSLALPCPCCGATIWPDNSAHLGVLINRLNSTISTLTAERQRLDVLRERGRRSLHDPATQVAIANLTALVAEHEGTLTDLRHILAACYGSAGT